ncbi:MAG: type II CRISPR RNA-guided endonuclease Cas9 [Clostridia bacterium]|nr:type II CRISPR RNA-guided endonuclease Cas9 [Clostridia bacterium]
MYDTNQNLNEVINDSRLTKTNTNLTIQEYLKNVSARQMEITYEDIENSYASPSVKRAAWQAIRIVKEITKLMGEKPDKIFLEVTRKDGEKGDNGRKASRTKKIEKIYESKEFQSEITKFGIELKEFKELQEGLSKESDGGKLRAEKTYLYYLQNGKCMYSLDSIDINKLENYDIDHVIPQSILKDDSFDNKVLVKKELNESSDIGKSDKFPIYNWNPTLYQKCKPYWEFLLKHGMISKKKFEILTRKTELTDDEKQAFINRQLVETNQSVKLVCDMLKGYVNNPQDIVYSKASNVTDFRKEFEIVKFRDINDYHHARDAYLNIVVGNVLHNRFTQRYKKDKDRTFINKELQQEENVNNNRTYHIIDLFKSNKPIYKYNDKNAIVWDKNKHLDQVKKICQKNSCTMSYFTTIKENGTFYDQSVYKSLNNDPTSKASVPLKDKDSKYIQNVGYSSMEKYGGYNSLKISYFMIIESKDKKGKTILTIESVPTYVCQKYKNQINKREKILEYLTKENDLIEPKIVIESLHCRSLLEIGGGKYLITTKTGNQCVLKNVNQWNATKEIVSYSKTLSKYLALNDNIRETLKATENEILVSERKNKKSEIISREKNIELYNEIVEQLSKRMYINDTVYKKMKEETEFFKSLDLKQQIELLNNIVKYLGGSFTVNIEYINGLKESGKIRIKKDITNLNITLIKQSVTGLKEKKVKIK